MEPSLLAAPDLTAVLAELEESIHSLAARRRWPPLPADQQQLQEHSLLQSSDAPAAARNNWQGAATPSLDIIGSVVNGVASSKAEESDAVSFESSLEQSQLQATIQKQIYGLQDITNLQLASGDAGRDKAAAGELFEDIRFDCHHARAVPCPRCGGHFFPESQAFHEAACVRRAEEDYVACHRCYREFRRRDLDDHLETCGKARLRVMQVPQRLDKKSQWRGRQDLEARQARRLLCHLEGMPHHVANAVAGKAASLMRAESLATPAASSSSFVPDNVPGERLTSGSSNVPDETQDESQDESQWIWHSPSSKQPAKYQTRRAGRHTKRPVGGLHVSLRPARQTRRPEKRPKSAPRRLVADPPAAPAMTEKALAAASVVLARDPSGSRKIPQGASRQRDGRSCARASQEDRPQQDEEEDPFRKLAALRERVVRSLHARQVSAASEETPVASRTKQPPSLSPPKTTSPTASRKLDDILNLDQEAWRGSSARAAQVDVASAALVETKSCKEDGASRCETELGSFELGTAYGPPLGSFEHHGPPLGDDCLAVVEQEIALAEHTLEKLLSVGDAASELGEIFDLEWKGDLTDCGARAVSGSSGARDQMRNECPISSTGTVQGMGLEY